jgi:hypothetical protein
MGANFANEMASGELDFLGLSLQAQMEIHLTSNFYPPIPASMATPCVQAIEAYWEEDTDREIELPHPIKFKGLTTAPAYAIIEQHKLHDWTVVYDYDAEESE